MDIVLQEKLSQYLDVVEVHLLKEISLRSDSFFEVQGQLEDLNGRIVEGCGRILALKETVRLLDSGLVDSTRLIQELSGSRGNLLVLQQKLRLILYVNQAISALKLLVASGDCAGTLDVTDDLENLMEGEELAGLHCFRHLRDHVTAAIDAVNSILSAEFMRTSLHNTGNIDEVILSKAKARANLLRNAEDDEVRVDEDDASTFRDRFLPVTIGLLRTAKLPSVLRIYRDTVTTAMKGTIKTAVAELLPVLLTRPMDSDSTPGDRAVDTDGGGSSLASKLRSLSSESFIQLLEAIFNIITARLMRASEVKRAIEWIMCNIDRHYAADSVNIAIALGSVASEVAQVDQASSVPSHSRSHSVPSLQLKANDGTSTSNLSKNFRRIVSMKVPETRKLLLLLEIDRVAQEVGYLQRVLSRTLHEVDVQAIFRQVVEIFHSQISEAFSQLEISTPQAQNRLRRDVEHILGCILSLPSDSPSKKDVPNWGQLDEFLGQRFTPVAD